MILFYALAAALVFAFVGALAWEVAKQVRGGSRFEARVIADSIHAITGSRLTTMLLTYPRFVHAELLTHRAFARNASSSRAIPSKKMRALIRAQMAIPSSWGQNKPGMQAGADVSRLVFWIGAALWVCLGHLAVTVSAIMDAVGLHKQIVNRIVEPWSHITVVLTGADHAWANFYALRVHPMADPTIEAIAREALAMHRVSAPRLLQPGEWHLPFVSDLERADVGDADRAEGALVRASVARCARTSYLTHDGTAPNIAKDIALYLRLVKDDPKHASPTEHQARVLAADDVAPALAGCFGPGSGWAQHRKEIVGESATDLGRFLIAA